MNQTKISEDLVPLPNSNNTEYDNECECCECTYDNYCVKHESYSCDCPYNKKVCPITKSKKQCKCKCVHV